jgi:CIC family chloride channel protein
MGTFYGGIAHVPLSALVMVCELAGNYDLLVPLMLSLGIAFVALRNRTIYHSQVGTLQDSTHQRDASLLEALRAVQVRKVLHADTPPICFYRQTPASEIMRRLRDARGQEVFPVLGPDTRLVGVISSAAMRALSLEQQDMGWAIAADLMLAPLFVRPDDDLRNALELMVQHEMRGLPVIDAAGYVVGMIDESEVTQVCLAAAMRADEAGENEGSRRPPPAM